MKTNLFPYSFPSRPAALFQSRLVLLVTLLIMLPGLCRADLDGDADGLSDTDETTTYGTNPANADTDGDGVPDGLELQMGTNPLDATSGLRILSQTPVFSPTPGWRICWSSVPGKVYELQRANLARPGQDGALIWETVVRTSAGSRTITACATDTQAAPSSIYRVLFVANPTADTESPIVSAVQATIPTASTPVSRLTVTARDLVGVARVEFLEGASVLGTGAPGPNHTYSFQWPLTADGNGRHYVRARAIDAAGNVGYSPVLALEMDALGGTRRSLTVGSIRIVADSITTTASGVSTATGHIRLNGVALSANSTVSATVSSILGNGSVTIPGIGTVYTGAFVVNPVTGLLTVRPGTVPTLPAISFNSLLRLVPSEISVNLLDGSICGTGPLTFPVSGHAFGPATFQGTVCYQPLAGTLTTDGSLTMGPLSSTGRSVVQLHDSTFTFAGTVRFRSANGETYSLNEATVRLSYPSGTPNLAVAGKLAFPDGLALQISGNVAATGAILLSGSGEGAVGGVKFSSIDGTLTRPAGANTLVTMNFRGTLAHPNLTNYVLAGTVRSNGEIDIRGTGNATFSGFRFEPLDVHATGNVLNETVVFGLSGTLRVSSLEPVTFSGTLRPDGSLELSGQSGPYTAASFGGLVPRMDDPRLRFEQKLFVGSYHLFARNSSLSTTVALRLTRKADSAGGQATLRATAAIAAPGLPTLTLAGNASSTGAWGVSGSLVSHNTILWNFAVHGLGVSVTHAADGVMTYRVTAGQLVYSGLDFNSSSAQFTGAVASDGSGLLKCASSTASLNGFSLNEAELQLAWSATGGAALTFTRSSVLVPGFGSLSVAIAGELRSNGSFSLTGRTASSLGLTGLPIATLASDALVTLSSSGLTIAGVGRGGILFELVQASAEARLAITSTGAITLSGSVTCSPLLSGIISVTSPTGGNLTGTLNNDGLRFSGARVRVDGILSAVMAIPEFTINRDGNFSVSVPAASPAGLTILGYPITSASFTLVRRTIVLGTFEGFPILAHEMSLDSFSARLNLGSFTQRLNGSIDSSGNVDLNWTGSLTVAGFIASNGSLRLQRTAPGAATLTAQGVFDLDAAGADFGNLTASGNISTSGSFALTGTTALTIDGFVTSSTSLTLGSTGLSAAADVNLNVGVLNISLSNLRISTGSGISFTARAAVRDTGWVRFVDALPTGGDGTFGDIYGRLRATIELSVSASGNITFSAQGTLGGWLVTAGQPDGITESAHLTVDVSVSSDGRVCFNPLFGDVDWCFDLW